MGSINFDGGRLFLDPQPVRTPVVALEVVMLGHCPGHADVKFLLAHESLRRQIEQVGYAEALLALETEDATTAPLFNLPIPLSSLSQFQSLFPQTADADSTLYKSRIAGSHPWLPQAVADFFERSSEIAEKRLWVINIDQTAAQAGFLPAVSDDWLRPGQNSAFTRALMLPRVGLMLMPDLERLQIPAQLSNVPKLRIANPVPHFLPCNTDSENSLIEGDDADVAVESAPPLEFGEVVAPMLKAMALYRPDMYLLMALPFDMDLQGELPQVSARALADITRLQRSQLRYDLHRLQMTYPYLKSAAMPLISASALLAGVMANTTAVHGSWRSTAGQPLPGSYQIFPKMNLEESTRLRDTVGVGVLRLRRGTVQLDDERLAAGVFHEDMEHSRSGEIARFLGWLRRQLQQLGNQLIFSVSPGDPRPRVVLNEFFTRLYHLGALRGSMPEQAFRIREIVEESTLIFDIEIAPAFPIDRIRLIFSQKQLEVNRA